MDVEKKKIPQIQASHMDINPKKEIITISFLDNRNVIDNEKDIQEHIISQISLSFEEYFDFASSFLVMGLKAQKELNIDLGINIKD